MGMQKNFFEVYRKFWHVPSKKVCQSQYRGLGECGWVQKGYITVCQIIELGTPGLLSNDGILDTHSVIYKDAVQCVMRLRYRTFLFIIWALQQAVCNIIFMASLGIKLYISAYLVFTIRNGEWVQCDRDTDFRI